jgi:hypothetical protein
MLRCVAILSLVLWGTNVLADRPPNEHSMAWFIQLSERAQEVFLEGYWSGLTGKPTGLDSAPRCADSLPTAAKLRVLLDYPTENQKPEATFESTLHRAFVAFCLAQQQRSGCSLSPSPAATGPLGCFGKKRFVHRPWRLTYAGPPRAPGASYRYDGRWHHLQLTTVPNTPARPFENAAGIDVDHDGTVVFASSWRGNDDQPHGIGRGIYRARGSNVDVVVDCYTTIPGRTVRFNEIGHPDIEDGAVAFWAGRQGWSGVYLWCNDTLQAIADSSMPIIGMGTPDLRGRRIGFKGRNAQGDGVFIWSVGKEAPEAVASLSDPMPDGERNVNFFDVVLGDQIAAFGASYGKHWHTQGSRRIVGWEPRGLWIVANDSWFESPKQRRMYLSPNPVIDGNSVAFKLHDGHGHSEIWVADGCTRTRIAQSGARVGQRVVAGFTDLWHESFVNGELLLFANFLDGTQGYILAKKPARGERIPEAQPLTKVNWITVKHASSLQRCYERERLRQPDLRGELLASWTIDQQGRAQDVVANSTELPASLADCVVQTIRRWPFSNVKKRPHQVSHTFRFEPPPMVPNHPSRPTK